jgi:hypothetical protein
MAGFTDLKRDVEMSRELSWSTSILTVQKMTDEF